jgi:hypothetical protein
MPIFQWCNPTPAQIAEAEALAQSLGEQTWWQGDCLCLGQEDPPPPPPEAVTARQARLALLGAGLLDNVDATLASIPDPLSRRAAQIEWEYALEIRRDSPLVAALAPLLGLTAEQVDDLFRAAEGL